MKRNIAIILLVTLIFGLLIKSYNTRNSYRLNTYLDYANGGVKEALYYKDKEVYTFPTMPTFFESILTKDSLQSPDPDWRILSSFPLYSKQSPQYLAGNVFRHIKILSEQLRYAEPFAASEIKQEFLKRLNDEGGPSAIEYAQSVEIEYESPVLIKLKNKDIQDN